MEIPPLLESQVREGQAVLFLGSGASLEARDSSGKPAPSSKKLAEMLADKFLGGRYKDHPLHTIAEYAMSESDLASVQSYIASLFEDLQPSDAHRAIGSFVWWGIATTNYDRLIERAYEDSRDAFQSVRPLIENADRVDENLRDGRSVILIKLHGCITRTTNPLCPLILTPDQYVEHNKGRRRLFSILSEWAYEHPLLFVGHSLQDSDLRAALVELTALPETRPRYYIVSPDVDDIKSRFWESKKITAIRGDFAGLMTSLDSRISRPLRGLAASRPATTHPIQQRFRVQETSLSRACQDFLSRDAEYVRAAISSEPLPPARFYRGFNAGFSAIESNLDVRRTLEDTILSDHVLVDESDETRGLEVVLIKAHAGAGKTVALRRIAWDAAHDYDRICLFLKHRGQLSSAAVQEIINGCRQRVFLFVDDGADRVRELLTFIKGMGPEGRFLTVVLAERINEWNIRGEALAPQVSNEYELRYLSSKEIDGLLALLEKHRALGTLESASPVERKRAFAERAGRQLLVALHEATLGRPFEDIVVDEYRNIEPEEAKRIYLTICVLNRLNVPVRAGIIARIHGVPFQEFKKRFFDPLELVVFAEFDESIRDYTYVARHPHIADIVFERVLSHPEERFDAYVKCLRALNLQYSIDRQAFRQMIRARALLDLFTNHELVSSIFAIAKDALGEKDAFWSHQRGLYEMLRANGSLAESSRFLQEAAELAPRDPSIKHSLAELRLRLAEGSRTPLEQEKLLKETSEICLSLISDDRAASYAHHTLAKASIRKLRSALETDAQDETVEKHVKEVERALFEGLQQFPGDPYLLAAEAQLASLLSDAERVLNALRKALAANPRSSLIALRLARLLVTRGAHLEAKEILKKALDANPSERRLHFEYAKLLMILGDVLSEELLHHLKRGFTDGDSNYDAQLLYGRQLFMNNFLDESRAVFRRLGEVRVPPQTKSRLMYPADPRYWGRVARLEASYCFLARDGVGDQIYGHSSNSSLEVWDSLATGYRVSFRIGFTFRGPNAFDIQLVYA